jgi:hypothetical protein
MRARARPGVSVGDVARTEQRCAPGDDHENIRNEASGLTGSIVIFAADVSRLPRNASLRASPCPMIAL